jgi:RNA polymerase sigma-70 factor (ECF subfamily)
MRAIMEQNRVADEFERHRQFLTGLAYRMLGSVAEAQDAVQEAYLRWHEVDHAKVANARAFLAKIVTRLCLDEMKSARARRETYVGPWLPEPVLNDAELSAETASEYAHDLSVGLLLALERLSPLERAAFLLHDVFDVGFAEVAQLLGRTEAACRQLAARARTNVRAAHPRVTVPPDKGKAIAQAFAAALASGDVSSLARVLAEDAVLHSDGGGKVAAALNLIVGRDKILRFAEGVARKFPKAVVEVQFATINGLPGFITVFDDGSIMTTALEIVHDRVTAIYATRNPEKLAHVAEALAQRH